MNRDTALLAVIGAVVGLALGAVVFLGLGGTTRTSVSSGTPVSFEPPPSDGSSGVVFGLHEQPGQSIFGISLTSSHYKAQVGMVAPDACVSSDEEGREVVSASGECANLPVRGEITGGGTSIEGDRIVIVGVDVSRECYEALKVGDTWPPSDARCSQPGD